MYAHTLWESESCINTALAQMSTNFVSLPKLHHIIYMYIYIKNHDNSISIGVFYTMLKTHTQSPRSRPTETQNFLFIRRKKYLITFEYKFLGDID
jgi:hypothetical protein